MTSRKWLLAAAAIAAALSGCATGPYYGDPYYGSPAYGYEDYSGGPGYYVAPPAVSFGFGFSNHDYYDGQRWHHWDGHHWHG
jgi:hypothetical protein